MIDIIPGGVILNLSFLFCIVFIDSLGFPGGLVWIISFGALASGFFDLSVIMLIVLIATVLGDITAYTIARKFSQSINKWLSRFKFYRNNNTKVRDTIKDSLFPFVFFTRFAITPLGTTVNYLSGFEQADRGKFIAGVLSGEILYATIYPLIGFIFKETWVDVTNIINDVSILIILLIAIALIGRYANKKFNINT